MKEIDKDLLYSRLGGDIIPLPQFTRESDGKQVEHKGEKAPFVQLVDENGYPISVAKPLTVQPAGNSVVEQKTEADTATDAVSFAQEVGTLEIYNVDIVDGVFNVNGIDITVPAGKSFKAHFGGTPRNTVTVSGSSKYILTRYE